MRCPMHAYFMPVISEMLQHRSTDHIKGCRGGDRQRADIERLWPIAGRMYAPERISNPTEMIPTTTSSRQFGQTNNIIIYLRSSENDEECILSS
jgi:hypothetical protein